MVEALTGIRVVEMAEALQGPAAAGYLRDMGAEVIRVESPEGDGARYHRGAYNYTPQGTLGAQFVHSNKGKRTISLDINSEQGREIIYSSSPTPTSSSPTAASRRWSGWATATTPSARSTPT